MIRRFITLCLLGLAATQASADTRVGDTLNLTFLSATPGRAVNVSLDGGSSYTTVQAGILNWRDESGGSVRTFCVQLQETVSPNMEIAYDVVTIENVPDSPPADPGNMGTARAELISDLYARNYGDVMSKTGTDARNWAAAFAIVIWEVTNQNTDGTTAAEILDDLDVTAGNAKFLAASSITEIATNMLNGLGGGTDDFLAFGVLGGTNPDHQDLMIVVPGPAGFLALAGFAAARRRRRG